MREEIFTNLYWKQYLLIEKEFRKSNKYVALSIDNYNTYSDLYARILLQIGSEVDVVSKLICKEINAGSNADNIVKYGIEILQVFPEFESVTINCNGIKLIP